MGHNEKNKSLDMFLIEHTLEWNDVRIKLPYRSGMFNFSVGTPVNNTVALRI